MLIHAPPAFGVFVPEPGRDFIGGTIPPVAFTVAIAALLTAAISGVRRSAAAAPIFALIVLWIGAETITLISATPLVIAIPAAGISITSSPAQSIVKRSAIAGVSSVISAAVAAAPVATASSAAPVIFSTIGAMIVTAVTGAEILFAIFPARAPTAEALRVMTALLLFIAAVVAGP